MTDYVMMQFPLLRFFILRKVTKLLLRSMDFVFLRDFMMVNALYFRLKLSI